MGTHLDNNWIGNNGRGNDTDLFVRLRNGGMADDDLYPVCERNRLR